MMTERNHSLKYRTGILMILLPFLITGCASQLSKNLNHSVPPAPDKFHKPEQKPGPDKAGIKMEPLPAQYQGKSNWSLAELIDLALRTSPRTKETWLLARSAAAGWKSQQGAYYPEIDVELSATRVHGSAIGGQFTFNQNTVAPSATLNYVLFNFGKREADIEESKRLLEAANWTHNMAIQDVILQVQQAYYRFLNAKALLQSQQASLERARTNYDAAEQRHQAGVSTIADVLQAKTVLSQAQLDLDTTEGEIKVLRGVLAVAIGLTSPAQAATLDVVDEIPARLPLEDVTTQVESLILKAIQQRPELIAARAQALSADARTRSVRAEGRPSVEVESSFDRLYYINQDQVSNNYSATAFISFPLFDGFSKTYNALQAQAEADAAHARVTTLQRNVGLEVWTAYFSLTTATQRIKTTETLVESAQKSYDVATGRYREGVGSILDLLSAQIALENAKVQEVQVRTDWLLSLAQLAHDTGTLGLEPQPLSPVVP